MTTDHQYTMKRYKKNLRVSLNNIFSYNTKVATVDHLNKQIKCLGWWSVTTQKHINYVGRKTGYEVIKFN